MKFLTLTVIALFVFACSQPRAKSTMCFDEISDLVTGKEATEVENLLGKPDSREALAMSGERWIWWNYTYLDGSNYAPEERGRVVHLEIIFELERSAKKGAHAHAVLRVNGPLGVIYSIAREES